MNLSFNLDPARCALLGHTGFVGGNLLRQFPFGGTYHSKNIGDLADRSYELIVCSAVSAVKWQANKDPESDWRGIQSLLDVLTRVDARRFILISTIDVYPNPVNVTESDDPSGIPSHAYGIHRLKLEHFVRNRFPVHHIVRLPGLFGDGLKKNVIYDLLHSNLLENIHPDGVFQYYDLSRLWPDLGRTMAASLPLLNVATEPLPTRDIVSRFFSNSRIGAKASGAGRYDFRSRHDTLWNGADGYLYSKESVMTDLEHFLGRQSSKQTL